MPRKIPKDERLKELEDELRPLLLLCLDQCASGRWGLFGHNDHIPEAGRYLKWPEADRLKGMVEEIRALRLEFGMPNELCERFAYYHSLRGPNVPGEPKLARQFLDELRSHES